MEPTFRLNPPIDIKRNELYGWLMDAKQLREVSKYVKEKGFYIDVKPLNPAPLTIEALHKMMRGEKCEEERFLTSVEVPICRCAGAHRDWCKVMDALDEYIDNTIETADYVIDKLAKELNELEQTNS